MWSNMKIVSCFCRHMYPFSRWTQIRKPLLCVAQSKANNYDKNSHRNFHAFGGGIENKYTLFTKTCCALFAVSVLGVAINYQK